MKKQPVLLLTCLACCLQLAAQRTISGTVTGAGGGPIPGATVRETGAPANGTASDADGRYSLKPTREGAVFTFRCAGFLEKSLPIGPSSNTLDAVLEEDIVGLDSKAIR